MSATTEWPVRLVEPDASREGAWHYSYGQTFVGVVERVHAALCEDGHFREALWAEIVAAALEGVAGEVRVVVVEQRIGARTIRTVERQRAPEVGALP